MENKQRSTTVQICQHCGKEFETQRRDAKYCSNACRQQAYLTRSAPSIVQRQISYIEDEIRTLESRQGYLTKQNIDYTFERIKELVNCWYYERLPSPHKLRTRVEVDLVRKIHELRVMQLKKNAITTRQSQ
jgi:hypothetical protein